ncbi:MAG: hypothetical protein RL417_2137 [Pseudomonadota bacterium]|jgi:DNA-binding transcriptional regulator/RsmH inhibitor MraZ
MAKTTSESPGTEAIRALAVEQLRFPPTGGTGPQLDKLMTGFKEVRIDQKGRFFIPASFRDSLGGGEPVHAFVPVDHRGVWIFSEREFKGLIASALENARRPINHGNPLETVTLLMNRSERIEPDSHHRILLGPDLLRASGLARGELAVVVGSGNFLELKTAGEIKPPSSIDTGRN